MQILDYTIVKVVDNNYSHVISHLYFTMKIYNYFSYDKSSTFSSYSDIIVTSIMINARD